MSKSRIFGLLLMVAVALFGIMSLFFCCHSDSTKPHRILVIHSYKPDYAGYENSSNEIKQAFLKHNIKVDLHIDYLDCEGFLEHATSIGRSIAGNNKALYAYLDGYHGDQMARELNMEAKHSVEKQAAHHGWQRTM